MPNFNTKNSRELTPLDERYKTHRPEWTPLEQGIHVVDALRYENNWHRDPLKPSKTYCLFKLRYYLDPDPESRVNAEV